MASMIRLVPGSLTLLAALAFAPDASAKAYYAPLSEVVDQVEAVAIVDTGSVAAVDIAGGYWRYHELVEASVVDAIAGTLPRRVEILGGRDFICAPVNWKTGSRYLALLEREGDRWTATNNDWGQIEIVDGVVDWPYDKSDALVPVDEIVKLLESRLEGRLGPGRIVDEIVEVEVVEPEQVKEIEPELIVATPQRVEEPAPPDESSPAPWIVLGAAAVVFGFVVGTRRRR